MDSEKVIKGLEWILQDDRFGFGENWTEESEPKSEEEHAGYNIQRAIDLLKEQEAVVRCKDCKYKGHSVFREDETEYIVCWNQGYGIQHPCDWFCADGERRIDDA